MFYGRSLGSGLAIDLAYRRRADFDVSTTPAVLITESAFASVSSFVNDATYVELPSSFVSESSWDNLTKIKSVQAPYLLFHGTADDYVDPRYSDDSPPRIPAPTSSTAWKGQTTATSPRPWG